MTANQPSAAPTKVQPSGPQTSAGDPRAKSRRRRITLFGLVTAVALALVSGGVYAVSRQSPNGGGQSADSGSAQPTVTSWTTSTQTIESATTVTATATPSRTSTADPPGTSESVAQTSTAQQQADGDWAEGSSPNIGLTGTPPQFPASLDGWRLQNSWDVTPRSFDTTWTDVPGPGTTQVPTHDERLRQPTFPRPMEGARRGRHDHRCVGRLRPGPRAAAGDRVVRLVGSSVNQANARASPDEDRANRIACAVSGAPTRYPVNAAARSTSTGRVGPSTHRTRQAGRSQSTTITRDS